jgi:hypothetical protein
METHHCQIALVDLETQLIPLQPLRPLANYKFFDPFEDRGSERCGSHLYLQVDPLFLASQNTSCLLVCLPTLLLPLYLFVVSPSYICENGALGRGRHHKSKALDG